MTGGDPLQPREDDATCTTATALHTLQCEPALGTTAPLSNRHRAGDLYRARTLLSLLNDAGWALAPLHTTAPPPPSPPQAIPDAAAEAVAEHLAAGEMTLRWVHLEDSGKAAYRADARRLLTAALPYLGTGPPPGHCPTDAPGPLSCSGMPLGRCELLAGHAGDHEAGSMRWWGPDLTVLNAKIDELTRLAAHFRGITVNEAWTNDAVAGARTCAAYAEARIAELRHLVTAAAARP